LDTLSHALWGKGLFGYRGHGRLALIIGAMPDLASFGALFFIKIITGTLSYSGIPNLESLKQLEPIPQWVYAMDNITHSFIVSFAVIGIVYALKPKLTWPLLAWPFHILLDFPFHTKEFFPVQLFWPLTSLSVDGISWSHPAVWYPNVAGIIILFIFRYKINLFNKL